MTNRASLTHCQGRSEETSLLEKLRNSQPVGRFDTLEERTQGTISLFVFDLIPEIVQTEHYCYRGVQFCLQNILDKHFLTAHTIELGKKETIGPDGKPQGDTAAYGMSSYLKHGPVCVTHLIFFSMVCCGSNVF